MFHRVQVSGIDRIAFRHFHVRIDDVIGHDAHTHDIVLWLCELATADALADEHSDIRCSPHVLFESYRAAQL